MLEHTAMNDEFLSLLAEQYPTEQTVLTEIINLCAILNLPRGTEHFISDVHGEYEAFCHILNNCSGVIREKAEALFLKDIGPEAINDFLTLIYYPEEKLELLQQNGQLTDDWYRQMLNRLILLNRVLSSKYTRSKVRKALPSAYAYVLDELLHAQDDEDNSQQRYHQQIIDTLLRLEGGDEFVLALCSLAKRLAVDRLHIVGDLFDRGPRADSILDLLMAHHCVDFEWGNHDILWMGAGCGNEACIAAVIRNCLAHGNTTILESGYGVSRRPLMAFAQSAYAGLPLSEALTLAITVIMFKLEGQLIDRHPEYRMEARKKLHLLVGSPSAIELDGVLSDVKPMPLTTLMPDSPYALPPAERALMDELKEAFLHSDHLQKHVAFLYQAGSMYRVCNELLIFHGCVPMTEGGAFAKMELSGSVYSGKSLMDRCEQIARAAYFQRIPSAVDFMWYLWCGENSPVCGRTIKTFERAFLINQETWKEPMNPYYRHCDEEEGCLRVLREYGLGEVPGARIINGHTPIRVKDGESPVKAGGRRINIDGGFCQSLHKTTGIAGYTLIASSHGMRLVAHQPFSSIEEALTANDDIRSESTMLFQYDRRKMVGDSDNGRVIRRRVECMESLLAAYRSGWFQKKP